MPAIIAIAIALVAVAVAIAAWFTPAPKAEVPAAKTYTEQETADAKKAVCEAFDWGKPLSASRAARQALIQMLRSRSSQLENRHQHRNRILEDRSST